MQFITLSKHIQRAHDAGLKLFLMERSTWSVSDSEVPPWEQSLLTLKPVSMSASAVRDISLGDRSLSSEDFMLLSGTLSLLVSPPQVNQ